VDTGVWPGEVPEILIPDPLRAELHMAGGRSWSQDRYLRFRLDPGRAFELHGLILDTGQGRFHASFRQHYRPDQPGVCISAATGMTADSLPGHLRDAVAHASALIVHRPAWHQAWEQALAWSLAWPLTAPGLAAHVHATAAGRAHDTGSTHFAYLDGERIICSASPPSGRGPFFSVTPRGHWSAHEGTQTFPLEYAPGTALFGVPPDHSSARLTAIDTPQAAPHAEPYIGHRHNKGPSAIQQTARQGR